MSLSVHLREIIERSGTSSRSSTTTWFQIREISVEQDWIGFFQTMAQVSITVFSLMFVAMQVRHKEWRGTQLRTIAAISALVELFVPMFTSMIILMAGHPWKVAAILGGGLGLVAVGSHWFLYRSYREIADDFDQRQMRLSLISLFTYSLLAVSALGQGLGLYMLSGICLWLLLSGSFEAWYVLDPKGLSGSSKKDL